MRTWYESELTSSDGSSVLTIASHWDASLRSTPNRSAAMPHNVLTMSRLEGYLAGCADVSGTIVDLGQLVIDPGVAGDGTWTVDDFQILFTSLLLEPEHVSARVRSGVKDLRDYALGIVMAHSATDSPYVEANARPTSVVQEDMIGAFEIANAAVFQRYIPTEKSPPTFDSLVNLAGVGGGLGLGVLVAAGAVAPIALLTVPGGLIAFGVGQGLKRRLRGLVDPLPRALREIRDLEREGTLTKQQADRLVDEELASRSK